MISRLRQWFKTKASYELSLRCLKDDLYIRARKDAWNEAQERRSIYYQLRSQYRHEESEMMIRLRTNLDIYELENDDLKQQIINLTASGITLKNELDEFRREI